MSEEQVTVMIARLEGKVDVLAERQEAGDRQAAQLVELLRPPIQTLQEEVKDLRAAKATDRVRIESLELSRARLAGMGSIAGVVGGMVGAALTGIAVKALGG